MRSVTFPLVTAELRLVASGRRTQRLHQQLFRRLEGSGILSPSPTENPRIGLSAIMITLGAVRVVVRLIESGSAPSGANLN